MIAVKRHEIKKLFVEIATCENCGAELVNTGHYRASDPPEYELMCPECLTREFTKDCYPRLFYEYEVEVQE